MKITPFTFGARLAFSARSAASRTYKYHDASIAEEKVNRARKVFQNVQLCWTAGKAGV